MGTQSSGRDNNLTKLQTALQSYSEDIGHIPCTASVLLEDPSDNYWVFQTFLKQTMDKHAPLKTAKIRANQAPFMNRKLHRAIQDKTRLQNRYRKYKTKENWEVYRKQKNVTTEIR